VMEEERGSFKMETCPEPPEGEGQGSVLPRKKEPQKISSSKKRRRKYRYFSFAHPEGGNKRS